METNFPKKLSNIYKDKKDIIQLKSFPINFKVIPNYKELLNRKIEREMIFHSHKIFQNEHSNYYNDDYLESFYNNLYHGKKRNNSYSKTNHNKSINNKNLNKSQSFFYITGKIRKNKKQFSLPKIESFKTENNNDDIQINKNKQLSLLKDIELLRIKKKKKSFSNIKDLRILFLN